MHYPKIQTAQAINHHTLLVEFTNHDKKQYDINRLLNNDMFLPLKNPAFFKNFNIEPTGCAIVWNEDIDISEYELWVNGSDIQTIVGCALHTI